MGAPPHPVGLADDPTYRGEAPEEAVMRESDLPQVDLESMNRDHRDQVEMLNAVAAALEALDGSAGTLRAVDEALEDFADHTREHFRQEDDQMRRYEHPPFVQHTEAHDGAIALLDGVVERWKAERDVEALGRYLRQDFPAWLVHHVTMMDTFAAQYISGHAH